jgi:PhnB protein
MGKVGTYLNFDGQAEAAFEFYAKTFGAEIIGITRIGEMPTGPGMPALSDAEQNLVANVQLPIVDGHVIMGSDILRSMGHSLTVGNNVTIELEPDTRAETDRLYNALSEGDKDANGLNDMPWGAYWGVCLDRFGVRWMFNCYEPAS